MIKITNAEKILYEKAFYSLDRYKQMLYLLAGSEFKEEIAMQNQISLINNYYKALENYNQVVEILLQKYNSIDFQGKININFFTNELILTPRGEKNVR